MTTNVDTCMTEGCDREGYSRGLCRTHVSAARYRIKRGDTSWEALEELGLCRPSKYEKLFTKQLAKARAAKSGGTPSIPSPSLKETSRGPHD